MISDRSAARLHHTRKLVDEAWLRFVEKHEAYDSIAEINLKSGDLVLGFITELEKKEVKV